VSFYCPQLIPRCLHLMSGILLSIRTLAEYTRARSCNCTATTDGDSAKCSILKNGISTAQVSSCAWFHLGQGHTLFQLICQPIGLPPSESSKSYSHAPFLPWASAWLTRNAGRAAASHPKQLVCDHDGHPGAGSRSRAGPRAPSFVRDHCLQLVVLQELRAARGACLPPPSPYLCTIRLGYVII